MEKVRVRELAKELGMKSSKEILLFLERIGEKGKSASSNIDGDVVERVRTHFRKGAPPPPPREKPLEVTRADGSLERKSSRVVLRRSAPEPEKPAEPPPPPPEVLDHKAETAPPSPDMPQEPPAVPEALQAPAVVEEKKAEPEIRVVEAPPPSKAEEERKEKEKKWKKAKPHEKKVQKGVLKKHIIQEIVEEPDVAPVVEQKPPAEAEAVVRQFQPVRVQKRRGRLAREKKAPSTLPPKASKRVFKIEEVITVGDLAHRMGIKAGEVIKKLIEMGMPTTVNQLLDADAAGLLAQEYGFEVENVAPEMESLIDQEADREEDLVARPPVVTIMGHVDHGKTSLLDAIRASHVIDQEAGGITQHIGAYEVEHNGRSLVMLDTPGHEAFTSMRARGAQVTDIVVLVVAAEDGVMPQTVEAIDHARAADVPIVVAVNKIDKPGAQPDRIRQQLSDFGLVPEEWGGQALYANISAKKKIGIDSLLELVLLQADILELKANPRKLARGTVIESRIEKGRGPIATVLVQDGTLKVGDPVVTGTHYGRVRALINHKGKRLTEALPGTPVEIQGLNGLPAAGQKFAVMRDERTARQIAMHRLEKEREKVVARPRFSLEELHRRIEEGGLKELNIVLKTDVQGSLEALQFSLNKLSGEKVKVNIIHAGAGGISESDVMLASASTAVIIGFNVRPEPKGADLAERERVDVRLYSVIYDVVEDIRKAMEGMLEPSYREMSVGRAEVRNTFHISRLGTVAGCFVLSGKITRNALVRLLRDNVVVHEGKLASLKRFKDDVREVVEGYECGLGLENFNDIKIGDQIEAFVMEKVVGTLA
ncbi:MAG: translation initiation factor IF-2, translation initiation factor IF-2 [Deltaproteobacteria bacterium CSP1-8]|nr:MAG: translation initiation factor IF-2, translation initiation factor IF-2 [Deltaproteobacteria bacterium CSP1-8]